MAQVNCFTLISGDTAHGHIFFLESSSHHDQHRPIKLPRCQLSYLDECVAALCCHGWRLCVSATRGISHVRCVSDCLLSNGIAADCHWQVLFVLAFAPVLAKVKSLRTSERDFGTTTDLILALILIIQLFWQFLQQVLPGWKPKQGH